MLSIIATIALVLAVIIAGVLAYASTRPGNFRVGRSASIKAPDRLFPLINDLQALNTWNLTLVRTHTANGLALAIVARSRQRVLWCDGAGCPAQAVKPSDLAR